MKEIFIQIRFLKKNESRGIMKKIILGLMIILLIMIMGINVFACSWPTWSWPW
jgi:hypothetical protein